MNHKKLFITAFIFSALGAFAQEKKVAVFDPSGKAETAIKEIVREEISGVIVNTEGYSVLERELIDKVLAENKFQLSGQVDDSQIGEIGKKLGADYVFVSTVTPLGANFHLSFKLIDVKTAKIEKQKTISTTNGTNDLMSTTQATTYQILGVQAKTNYSYQTNTNYSNNNSNISSQTNNRNLSKAEKEQMLQEKERQFTSQIQVSDYKACGFEIMTIDYPRAITLQKALQICPQGWRLPTAQELKCMCDNKFSIGGFQDKRYMSREVVRSRILTVTFNDCEIEKDDPEDEYFIRFVR